MSTFYIYILFISALVLLASFVFRSAYIDSRKNKMFNLAILSNALILIGYIGRDVAVSKESAILGHISNELIYIFAFTACYCIVLTIMSKELLIYKLYFAIFGIYLFNCAINPFTKLFFVISSKGVYERGPLSEILYVLNALAVLIWFILLAQQYKDADWVDKIRMGSMCILEIGALILQLLDSQYKISYLGGAFFIILYYVFTIETVGKYDALTGLFSRRYYELQSSSLKLNSKYSIILFDANGLKAVNDGIGHEAGDRLIKTVGKTIKICIGKQGRAFRIGGDEFVAIVKHTDKNKIDLACKEIDKILESESKTLNFEVSTSIGYAIHENGESFNETSHRADEEMYKSKNAYYERTGKTRRA